MSVINHPIPIGAWAKCIYFKYLFRIEQAFEYEHRYRITYADGMQTSAYIRYDEIDGVYDSPYPVYAGVYVVGHSGKWRIEQLYVEPGSKRIMYFLRSPDPPRIMHLPAEEIYLPCK